MKTSFCLVSGLCALMSAGCAGVSQASVEPPVPVVMAPPPPAEKGSLDELVAPIALYPDALVALILPAATTSSDVVLAARYLAGGGDRAKLDEQPWEDSVKALAHYPDVVKWMDENLSWTQQLGAAYLDGPADVMAAIQRDRARAKASGVLADTAQQQVVMEEGNIRIIPAQPEVIYVPRYDPQIVYVERPVYYSPDPWLTFGLGLGVGSWLAYDCDWRARTIWIDHHRHQRWREHRHDWRHPHFPNRPEHGANHPGWQRWKPSPDRHVEHRWHRDRHERFTERQRPAIRMPEPSRDRPDDRWQNRDHGWNRHRPGLGERNRRADHIPGPSESPANRVPRVHQPPVPSPRPERDIHRDGDRPVDRERRWQHDRHRDRAPLGSGDGRVERRPMPHPSHDGERPAINGGRPSHRLNPPERTAPRFHTPPAAPAASHQNRSPEPARVQSAPAPAPRQERPAHVERRAERSEIREGGRGHGARRHEN